MAEHPIPPDYKIGMNASNVYKSVWSSGCPRIRSTSNLCQQGGRVTRHRFLVFRYNKRTIKEFFEKFLGPRKEWVDKKKRKKKPFIIQFCSNYFYQFRLISISSRSLSILGVRKRHARGVRGRLDTRRPSLGDIRAGVAALLDVPNDPRLDTRNRKWTEIFNPNTPLQTGLCAD